MMRCFLIAIKQILEHLIFGNHLEMKMTNPETSYTMSMGDLESSIYDLDDFISKVTEICEEEEDYSLLLDCVNDAIKDTTIHSNIPQRPKTSQSLHRSIYQRQLNSIKAGNASNGPIQPRIEAKNSSVNIPAVLYNIPKVEYKTCISEPDRTMSLQVPFA